MSSADVAPATGRRKRSIDAIAFDAALLAFVLALLASLPERQSARLVPLIILVPTAIGVSYQLFVDLVPWRYPGQAAEDPPPPDVMRRQFLFVGWLLAFFVLSWLTSLLIVLPIALFAIFRFVNRQGVLESLALAGGMWGFIYLMFAVGLGVRF